MTATSVYKDTFVYCIGVVISYYAGLVVRRRELYNISTMVNLLGYQPHVYLGTAVRIGVSPVETHTQHDLNSPRVKPTS